MSPERPFGYANALACARSLARAIFVILAAFLSASLAVIVGTDLLVAVGVFARGDVGLQVAGTVLQLAGFGVAVAGYFAIGHHWDVLRLRAPTLRDVGWTVAGVVAILVGAAAVGQLLARLGVNVAQNQVMTVGRENPEFFLYMIPVSLLLVGPFEELVFRGAVQGFLRRTFGVALAVVIASALFGVVHWLALTGGGSRLSYVAVAATLGLILGYVYERTENLVVPSVVHGVYNSVLFGVQYAAVTGLLPA